VIEDRTPDIVEHEVANNRACFVLLSLLEGGFPSVQPELVSALRRLPREPSTAGGKLLAKTLVTLAAGAGGAADTGAGAGGGADAAGVKKAAKAKVDAKQEGTKKKKKSEKGSKK
jgi:hypothetical protein